MDPMSIGLLVLIPVAFYFLLIRPQSKRQKQQQQLLAELQPGQTVMLSSGVVAKIVEMGREQVLVEIAPGLEMTVLKQAIMTTKVVDEFDEDADVPPPDVAADREAVMDVAADTDERSDSLAEAAGSDHSGPTTGKTTDTTDTTPTTDADPQAPGTTKD